jgi:hypothetical protein
MVLGAAFLRAAVLRLAARPFAIVVFLANSEGEAEDARGDSFLERDDLEAIELLFDAGRHDEAS